MPTHPLRRALLPAVAAIGLLAAFAVDRRADAAEESLQLLPRWTKGEKVRFELTKSRKKTQGDKVTFESANRTDVDIEVLSASEDAFVLAWTSGETKFDGQRAAEDASVQTATGLLKGLRVVFELDSQASIQGVRNWKELQETTTKLLGAVADDPKSAGADPAAAAKVRAQVASMFAGKQQIERLCAREAQLLFMVLGVEFEGGTPVEYEDKLPNPFGGEPFPSRARFALKDVDRKLGVANVAWTQTVAPDDARRIMEKTLRDLAERLGKPVPDGDKLKSLTIEDAAEFHVDVATGWMRSVSHRRATKTEGSSQDDVVTFTRKTDAKAPRPSATTFPDDENGDVLRRMEAGGDDLTKPRDVNFDFVFANERKAGEFAERVRATLGLKAETSRDEERKTWDATVTKNMTPTHRDITALEQELIRLAATFGGKADGWGCFQVDKER